MYDVNTCNMTMPDDSTTYQTMPVLHKHQKYIGTILTKILATNFSVPAKFDKNDQLSSNSMPMVHRGTILLAKNQVSLAKSEK